MNTSLISANEDPMGAAINDYHKTGKADKLRVFSSQFDEDEIPVRYLFRRYHEMPDIEKEALKRASGKILDIGAGSGCHSLVLQKQGLDVTAIDISALAVEVMKLRGIKKAFNINIFNPGFCGQFDTILMLMNGTGIIGKINEVPEFFRIMKKLLSPNGRILIDSTDLRYLYEDEDGSFDISLNDCYYGEVDFRMQYREIEGRTFDWLYIDYETFSFYAEQNGFSCKKIHDGKHYDYLAEIAIK